jgi:uncharacterized protein
MDKIQTFFQQFKDWGEKQEDILGVALVGSHARNAAKEYSDIDLMIIVKTPKVYLDDNSWINLFGKVKQNGIKDEDWGLVETKRVFYENGIEAEFNFSTEIWTKTNPIDEGTKKVMKDGNKILVDKNGLLKQLADSI